jgi:hypothetical protein
MLAFFNTLETKQIFVPISTAITITAVSIYVLKSKFIDLENHPIAILNPDSPMNKLAKEAFIGGRVESYDSGLGHTNPFFHFDFSGLYGEQMTKSVPIGNALFLGN